MRLIRNVYAKTYEDLERKFSTLFWCVIHIPYEEAMKMDAKFMMSLKIRGNRIVFEDVK